MKKYPIIFLTFMSFSFSIENNHCTEPLYAPWRGSYCSNKEAPTRKEDATSKECIFCTQFAECNDEKNFIIKRLEHSVIMMARYPYTQGHLLILPLEHTNRLEKMSVEAQSEIMRLLTGSCTILTTILQADGINVGLNLGRAAGAGIPSHLHWHIVPRWSGDTTFMQVIGRTYVYEFDLEQLYNKFKTHFEQL